MIKRDIKLLYIIMSILLVSTVISGCTRKQEPITKYGFYFDTVIAITLYQTQEEKYMDECFELAEKYEDLFSRTKEGSDIYRINDAKGEPVVVSDETIDLIEKGLSYGILSEGRFDITVGALSSLWNFKSNDGVLPKESDVEEVLSSVSYEAVHVDGNTVTLENERAQLDLGGIAKGYVADKMKEFLKDKGVTGGIINLGGNILAVGEKQDGEAFVFGIQKPFSEDGASIATVEIKDQTVVTSGVYERYFTVDDVVYHHILDTKTGYPVRNNLLSATIICDNSADADALSTICYSLGLDRGLELIESLEGTEAIFITDDYTVHKSSGLGTDIVFQLLT